MSAARFVYCNMCLQLLDFLSHEGVHLVVLEDKELTIAEEFLGIGVISGNIIYRCCRLGCKLARMRLDGFVRSIFNYNVIGIVSSFFQTCYGKAIAVVGNLLGILCRVIAIATWSKSDIQQLTLGIEGKCAEYLIAFLDDDGIGVGTFFGWPGDDDGSCT